MTLSHSSKIYRFFLISALLIVCVNVFAGKPAKLSDKELEKRILDCKQFDMERISVNGDTVKIDYCLNAECSTFRTWRFAFGDIGEIKIVKEGDFHTIQFTCKDTTCVLTPPTGVTYEPKTSYSLYVKGAKEAKSLLSDIEIYRGKK